MSALHGKPSLHSALTRIVYSGVGVAMEKMEQCDGCRRVLSMRQVELVGKQILCCDCAPSEFTAPLHPHLPAHPRRVHSRTDARP
ncbi:MAG: hypothetical protein ABMA26_26035 [Limisphaerales bacterium]